ncbi:chemotaxis protein CheW [Desulfococcaceae bacterium HSG8]|nr:chemotaxis protein CheW [Desulfococcaceae bacterium HSG8]
MESIEQTNSSQYLTFTLGEEIFALGINRVREVLDYKTIGKVPGMPPFIRGVINLRGDVVPVIDLRVKLGMTLTRKETDTCIVIMEINVDGELVQMGALADSVREVTDLTTSQVAPPPKIGKKYKIDFIKGIGKQEETFLIILDIDRVLSEDERSLVRATAEVADSDSEEISSAFPPMSDMPDIDVMSAGV